MYKKLLLFASVFFLALIPFFWLKPGEIDLGGDSSRLYLYDPINYLKSFPLYTIAPNGFNTENNAAYLIPFVLLLAILKKILQTPYLLATVMNSFSLTTAFLSIYGIIMIFFEHIDKDEEKINRHFAAILGGFFYALSPSLTDPGWWKAALVTHYLFFLNPLMFFLLLSYVTKRNFTYLLIFLLVSFAFSPNFFLSPYFFSFYPLTFLFLLIYAITIIGKLPSIKQIGIGLFLYFILHGIHIFPQIIDVFKSTTNVSEMVLSTQGKFDRGLGYFLSIEKTTIITNNLLGLSQGTIGNLDIHILWIIIPMLIVGGLILQKKVSHVYKDVDRTLLLVLIFFLLTFFLVTAKITNAGLELYKFFFNIPGFSMFRNYVGQFTHVFIFYYALVFGMSMFYILHNIKKLQRKAILLGAIMTLFTFGAFPFIGGNWIRDPFNPGSKEEIKMSIRFDPEYEHVLEEIRKSPFDGKYLLFPLDDAGAQVLRGKTGGYIGIPTLPYLTQMSAFSGLSGMEPFFESFGNMVGNKDYVAITNLFSFLNIKYVFYNSDDKIYGSNFLQYPYARALAIMPPTQDLYKGFLENLNLTKKIDVGQLYHIYELDKKYYRPHIYIAKENYLSEDTFSLPLPFQSNNHAIFICNNCFRKM